MKVGLIVYSHSGNTLSVAEKLKNALTANGHCVVLERVTAVNEMQPTFELKHIPNISGYDAVIFGSPVHAFSLSAVMKAYMNQLSTLSGKKAGVFVTQKLPFKWMGGAGALNQMKSACVAKGTDPIVGGSVNWDSKKRNELEAAVIQKLSQL